MKTNKREHSITKETFDELTALVREKHPDAQCDSIEEILAVLLPAVPEDIARNQAAVKGVHAALQAAQKAITD